MRAAVIEGGTFVTRVVDDPTPGPDDLIIGVAANGICGSDLSTAPFLPDGTIMGHEFAGEVVAAGAGAAPDFPVGTPVAAMPVIGCTHCRSCVTGDIARCPHAAPLGLGGLPGALADYVRVHRSSTIRLDPLAGAAPVSLVDAALTEPLAVGLHAVERARIRPGDRVLVLGAGPVGLAVLYWLSRSAAVEVVCSDPAPGRRTAATELGVTRAVEPDAVAAEPDRYDVVVECSGRPGLIAAATVAAASHGRVVVAGVCMTEDTFMPVAGIVKELSIDFVSFYTLAEFTASAAAVVRGEVPVEKFVSARVPLEDTAGVFEALRSPDEQRKVLIFPGRHP